jgi:hypothetical protein
MADKQDYMQLSEHCFGICETLKTAIQGKNADDLNESVRTALEDLERCVRSRSLVRWRSQTHSGVYAKSRGLSGKRQKHHILNITRRSSMSTCRRSKRYPVLSGSSMKTST